ncbi:MAG: hypothetical protein ACRDJ5_03385, partial [Actinomycetota bacterium]
MTGDVSLQVQAQEVASVAPSIPALIIAPPLAVSIVLMLFGRRIGRASGWIASGAVLVSFLLGLALLPEITGAEEVGTSRLWAWIESGGFDFSLEFLADQLSMTMVLVVSGVGFLIHVYSVGYMHGD